MKIGIPVSESKTQYFINYQYCKYVSASGYMPVMITPEMVNNGTLNQYVLDNCNGLLLPGGIDVDPIYYGEDNYSSMACDPEKDAFERTLLYSFIKVGKSVFGICRGMQLLVKEYLQTTNITNLWFTQHISGHSLANDRGVKRTQPTHFVRANVKSLYGAEQDSYEKVPVNSMHHQGLLVESKIVIPTKNNPSPNRRVGNIHILAYTKFGLEKEKNTYLVEAVDINNWGTGKIRGVQHHPEELMDVNLLTSFFGKEKTEETNEDSKRTLKWRNLN